MEIPQIMAQIVYIDVMGCCRFDLQPAMTIDN